MYKKPRTLPAKEIVTFCRQLIRLLKQGVGLRTALLLIRDMNSGTMRERMTDMVHDLDQGSSFGEALKGRGFPALFISFVMAGEHHSGLVQALEKCAWYYRRRQEVRQKLTKSLVYPLMVFCLMIMTFIVLQTTVLPRFAALYDTMGIDLPWYTQLLLTVNQVGLPITVIIMTVCILVLLFYRKRGLTRLFHVSLKIPVIRETWQLRFTSVFSWQLGLLLQSGIPLLQAFEMIIKAWPWEVSRQAIFRVQARLENGFSLQASFTPEAGKSFHTLLPQQLAIGEASGAVAETLLYSGETADEQLEERVQWLLRIWEPLLIFGIGVLLAAMVLALFVPMFSLVEGI